MKGKVNARREAVVRLQVCGRKAARRSVTAIVDTGYGGSLTLPASIIRSLGLRHRGESEMELGDGSLVMFSYYRGVVIWDGQRRTIEVDEAQTDPLIGMALLDGFEVNIRVEPDGDVSITPLH